MRLATFALLGLLAVAVLLDRLGTFGYRGDDWASFDQQTVLVTRVVDGQTLLARVPDSAKELAVRLLGIEVPDSDRSQAIESLMHQVEGKSITLRLPELQTRDRSGRLLAYLYDAENNNLNLDLIRQGRARADRSCAHALLRSFEQAEQEARRKRRGVWGTSVVNTPANSN